MGDCSCTNGTNKNLTMHYYQNQYILLANSLQNCHFHDGQMTTYANVQQKSRVTINSGINV